MMETKKNKRIVRVLWFLIFIGFAIMEFPGIFFINRIEPTILGFPFIYGFMIIMWLYMCVVLLAAYKTRWGKDNSNEDTKKGDLQQ